MINLCFGSDFNNAVVGYLEIRKDVLRVLGLKVADHLIRHFATLVAIHSVV